MGSFHKKLTVVVILLSVTFLILISYSINRSRVSPLESGFGYAIGGVERVLYKAGSSIKESFSFITNIKNLKTQNEELIKKNNELEQKSLEYDFLKSENQKLKDILNFNTERSDYSYLPCDIISKTGSSYLDGYIINRGYKDGIKNGMAVLVPEGLVGQVTSTAANWSTVQTLSNENIAVAVLIQNTNENVGIVRGYRDSDNNLLAKVYLLPIDSEIKKDDIILTSGTGNLYPRGIRIGKVLYVEEDKGRIQKTAVIEPFADFTKITTVEVVVPKQISDAGEIQY
jgi:rod shape-determining protein MreC